MYTFKRIKSTDTQAIEAALLVVQEETRLRDISVSNILAYIEHIESHLDRILDVQHWRGMSYEINVHAMEHDGCHNFIPAGTVVDIEREGDYHWYITDIRRDSCNQSDKVVQLNEFTWQQVDNIKENAAKVRL